MKVGPFYYCKQFVNSVINQLKMFANEELSSLFVSMALTEKQYSKQLAPCSKLLCFSVAVTSTLV
jgi:hypothetical protein